MIPMRVPTSLILKRLTKLIKNHKSTIAGKIPKDFISPRIHSAFSMSSWFCIPEEQMLDLEILSRASTFLVKSKKPSFGRKFHVVTVSHTIAPWRWPKYYPQDWIQVVNEKHTQYSFEIRSSDGSIQKNFDCIPRSYHHNTKDLAVLHIKNEQSLIKELFTPINLADGHLLPSTVSLSLTQDDMLEFQGHDISHPATVTPAEESQEDTRVPIPCSVKGCIAVRTKHQNFAYTHPLITDGMCGGPILTRRSLLSTQQLADIDAVFIPHITPPSDTIDVTVTKHLHGDVTDTRYIVGMMDGIVSPTNDNVDLRGLASFVDASDIERFLDAIENENIDDDAVVLVGEKAAKPITPDLEPHTPDLSKAWYGFKDDNNNDDEL